MLFILELGEAISGRNPFQNGFISKSFLPGAMAPFSCFPGGSCGSCGSPPRAGPEEQGKRTAGGWDCELGNGMELKEAQRSMVGDFELILGLKEVEGS